MKKKKIKPSEKIDSVVENALIAELGSEAYRKFIKRAAAGFPREKAILASQYVYAILDYLDAL